MSAGDYSHAEGNGTEAIGNYSHAEGQNSCAEGEGSHAEGLDTHANGIASHTEGYQSYSTGDYSHVEGYGTYTDTDYSHVQGKYNAYNTERKYAFIIGNGTSNNNRSNAFAVDWDGLIYVNNSSTGINLKSLFDEMTNKVDKITGK